MDEDTDMVWAALKMIQFFKHESCGKCTPCREGTYWLERVLEDIYHGRGRPEDIALLENVARNMQGKCLCALGEFATSPVLSTIVHFPEEYRAKVAINNGDGANGSRKTIAVPAQPAAAR
jgi:NADH-quinone oxidoreductase subunit F